MKNLYFLEDTQTMTREKGPRCSFSPLSCHGSLRFENFIRIIIDLSYQSVSCSAHLISCCPHRMGREHHRFLLQRRPGIREVKTRVQECTASKMWRRDLNSGLWCFLWAAVSLPAAKLENGTPTQGSGLEKTCVCVCVYVCAHIHMHTLFVSHGPVPGCRWNLLAGRPAL